MTSAVRMDCGEIGPFCLWPFSPCVHHMEQAAEFNSVGHSRCTEQFCRAPLHPGPCKRFRTPLRGLPRRDTGEPDLPGTSARRPRIHKVPTGQPGADGHPPPPKGKPLIADRASIETGSAQMVRQLAEWRQQDADYEQAWLDAQRAGRPSPDPDPAKMPPSNGNRNPGSAAAVQGFTGPPVVASDADLDRAIQAGGVEVWRGVSGGYDTSQGRDLTPRQVIEQLRSGDAYYGNGLYGSGMYFGDDHTIASEYAGGQRFGNPGGRAHREGAVVRAVLRPGARVISYEDARDQRKRWQDQMDQVPVDERMDPAASARWRQTISMLGGDLGSWAAMMGYDAIHADEAMHGRSQADESRHWVILNRGAMMLSDQTERVGP